MKGSTQHHWLHQIPKTKKPIGKRINLTFRLLNIDYDKHLYLLSLLFVVWLLLQSAKFFSYQLHINRHVDGTLLIPDRIEHPPLVIIIAGSGPTDRNGNQSLMKNDMLKKLAEGLSKRGIATFRYDKRVVKQLRTRNLDKNIRFDDFVTDAKSVVNHFKSTYSSIVMQGIAKGV